MFGILEHFLTIPYNVVFEILEHFLTIPFEAYCKISNSVFSFCSQILVIGAGTHELVVRIANREDLDQTASTEAV